MKAKKIGIFILVLYIFFLPLCIFAENKKDKNDDLNSIFKNQTFLDNRADIKNKNSLPGKNVPKVSEYIGKFFYATTFFIIIAALFYLYIKSKKKAITNENIRIIDNISLGAGKNILLLLVYDEILVIGMTPSNMSLLTKITDEDIIEDAKNESTMANFKELMILSGLNRDNNKK